MAPVLVGEPLDGPLDDSSPEDPEGTSAVVLAEVSDFVLGSAASETPSVDSVVDFVGRTLTVRVSFMVAVVVPSMVSPSVALGVI